MGGLGPMPPSGQLEVGVVERSNGRLRVRIAGELDVSTAGPLLEALEDATDPRVRGLEIDIADVSFIDSSALGVLVRAHKRLAQLPGGKPLVLVSPRPQARKVLEITGLTRVFVIADD